MKAGNHDEPGSYDSVENAVWKSWQECPSNVPMHNGALLGCSPDRIKCFANNRQKLVAKPGSPGFVPRVCVLDIGRRGRAELDPLYPRRLRI
jgi:hypothetical protein